jgi:putative FmdB family regulatory protein
VPTYTYTCIACNDVIEKRQSFSDPPLTTCEQCGGSLRKIIHPVGIVFKGSGWYITDSRSSSSTPNGPSAASKSDSSKDSSAAKEASDSSASTASSKASTSSSSESKSSD